LRDERDPLGLANREHVEREYAVVLEYDPEAKAYAVLVPALPEIATAGDSVEEALMHARDAIALSLEYRREHGLELPDSDHAEVRHVRVTVPAA